MDSFTTVSIDGGDFPDVILRDGDDHDQAALIFRTGTSQAQLYLVFQCGDTNDGTDAGFRFALWLEQVAEAVRDRAFNRRTRDDIERDEDYLARLDAEEAVEVDEAKAPF